MTFSSIQDLITSAFTRMKKDFLPPKIAIGSIIAVLTFVWSFPNLLKGNPLFEYIFRSESGISSDAYFVFTGIWLGSVVLLLELLFFTFLRQRRIETLLENFKNIDRQYELFSEFMRTGTRVFIQKDLEKFIEKSILDSRSSKKSGGKHNMIKKYSIEIIPVIAEMMIQRALDKGLVKKGDTPSWYDEYIFLNEI